MRNLGILGLAGASLFLVNAAKADVVTEWNDVAVGVSRRLALGSNKSTRSLAITHLAVHDTVQSVTRKYRPYRLGCPCRPYRLHQSCPSFRP